jgi:TRAP-type mannitol/chloroaromatic compound transport system permease small subunit
VSRVLHYIDLLSEWTGKGCSFLIIALSFIEGFEVVARYVFKRPTIWAHETSSMIFGAYIIFGGAYTLYLSGHVNMDLIYVRTSPRGRALLDVITFWLFALFCVVLVWKGGETSWRALETLEHSGSIWNPPMYPIRVVLPTGACLLLLQGIAKFVRDVMTLVGGKSP